MKFHITALSVFALALVACNGAETSEPDPPTNDSAGLDARADTQVPPDVATTIEADAGSEGMGTVREVMYGGSKVYDACAQAATVGNLNSEGDNFLSVRAAPKVGAAEVDRLGSGQAVAVCESESGWYGIVYQDKLGLETCGTGTPVASRGLYDGTCQSGWVDGRYLVDFIG